MSTWPPNWTLRDRPSSHCTTSPRSAAGARRTSQTVIPTLNATPPASACHLTRQSQSMGANASSDPQTNSHPHHERDAEHTEPVQPVSRRRRLHLPVRVAVDAKCRNHDMEDQQDGENGSRGEKSGDGL